MRRLPVAIPKRLQRLVWALLLSNALSVLLFGLRVLGSEGLRYWFMLWNLLLAWLPLLFALLLYRRLSDSRWSDWRNIGLTLLWLGFLPNSFYLLTDLIHLQSTGEINILFDTVMLASFIFNGFVAGFLSVYLVHWALLRRWATLHSSLIIGGVFLLSGYAIYLGRSMRWNTWDVLVNPAGLLFDLSEGIVNPLGHPQIFVTTFTFFLLLSTIYFVMYQLAEVIRTAQHR